jgi:hypothetical protein
MKPPEAASVPGAKKTRDLQAFFIKKTWRHPVWYTDWQQTMAMAEAEGKPVLLDFHNPG